jgi:hypothetical protein
VKALNQDAIGGYVMRSYSKRVLLVATCALLATGILRAQSVAPPPRPDADSSLAATLESLKQALLAPDNFEYRINDRLVGSKVASVKIDPPGCQMRVEFDKYWENREQHQQLFYWYFFESIDSAEAMTLQESSDQRNKRLGSPVASKLSAGYQVVINGNNFWDSFEFADKEAAVRVSDLLLGAARVCRQMPVRVNGAAGPPNLQDTLRFIEQKLNDEAAVVYDVGDRYNDNPEVLTHNSFRVLDARADLIACRMHYRDFGTFKEERNEVLSFRRVIQIQVQSELEVWEAFNQKQQQHQIRVTPSIWRLVLWGPQPYQIWFRDEDTANRVAKAMNHAAELCRAGETKEPF